MYVNRKFEHFENCDCFECDNADLDTGAHDAGYYLGSTLKAKSYVTTYDAPFVDSNGNPIGKVLAKISPGLNIGVIDSWVTDPKTKTIWWVLKNKQGFVAHYPGYFDATIAVATSSGKAFDESLAKANNNPDDVALASLSKTVLEIPGLKWILIGVVVAIVGIVVIKLV